MWRNHWSFGIQGQKDPVGQEKVYWILLRKLRIHVAKIEAIKLTITLKSLGNLLTLVKIFYNSKKNKNIAIFFANKQTNSGFGPPLFFKIVFCKKCFHWIIWMLLIFNSATPKSPWIIIILLLLLLFCRQQN